MIGVVLAGGICPVRTCLVLSVLSIDIKINGEMMMHTIEISILQHYQ